MATEVFSFTGEAGISHYLAIFNDAGQIFDWNDSTFKALSAPPTTKATAGTEQTDLGGTGFSAFIKSVDLTILNNTTTPTKFRADWYTDNAATARVSETVEFWIRKGALYVPGAMNVALAEPSAGVPSATPSAEEALSLLYFATTNEVVVTETSKTFKNRAGTAIFVQPLTETSTVYTEGEMEAPA